MEDFLNCNNLANYVKCNFIDYKNIGSYYNEFHRKTLYIFTY